MTTEDLALAGICADAPFGPCTCGICRRETTAAPPPARRWHTDRPWSLALFVTLTALAVWPLDNLGGATVGALAVWNFRPRRVWGPT